MKNSILAAAIGAAALSFATVAPAQAGVVSPMKIAPKALVGDNLVEKAGYRRRRRHLGYGALATLGVLGIIAASRHKHSRRHHYRERRYDDYGHRCRRWRRWCRRGNDRACWKFDTRC